VSWSQEVTRVINYLVQFCLGQALMCVSDQ
jgi:hypothetical protein